MKKPTLVPALLCFGVLAAQATENVTTITTRLTTGTASTTDGNNFDNNVLAATSLATATANYVVSSLADNVFVRRNSVNANQSSVWYTSNGGSLSGVAQPTYDQMLLSNNLYVGTDNTFANGTGATTGNIERLDFTWKTARTASSTLAFGVFDRGAVNVHDSFAIAAITAVDAQGNPTAYSSLVKVAAGWGGTANAIGDQSYRLFRYGNGDNLATANSTNEAGTQGIGGVLIKTSDLGLADGTQVYGYSLMAADVAAADSSQLVDYTNGAIYPTTTDGNTGGGGIDLAALNGLQLQAVVPEPASWVLFSLAAPLAWFAARRGTRKRRSAA